MKITAKVGDLEKQAADLLVVNLFSGVKKPGGGTGAVDKALGNLLTQLIREENFKGELGETLLVRAHNNSVSAKKVLLVGLGKKEKFDGERIRRAAGAVIKVAKKCGSKSIVTILHGAGEGGIAAQEAAEAIVVGSVLADYSFCKYQKKKVKQERKQKIEGLTIVDHNQDKVEAACKGIDRANKFLPGVILARDLVNEPGIKATPATLVKQAKEIAQESGAITCKIFEKNDLEKMGAGALLAVARGSEEPPYLIHLIYKPKHAKKKIALLGKGVTFDTGGYSLKPWDAMTTMKSDMGGAATVLGIFKCLDRVSPSTEIHGVIPVSENLISGKAIKPGDVVTAMNGETIEVINTDAEGRMLLADAFSYIGKEEWDEVIDFATLTGACVVALGEQVAGLFSNDEKLAKQVREAAVKEGEQIWQMPLVEDYNELLKSKVADLRNISTGRWGGAITAALFLQNFVPKKTAWVHIDMGGPAFEEKGMVSYMPYGGTGFGVRTALRFLEQ